ncbi:hypothetical protein VP01_4120g2 [Puccinia sorghi]|uniref:Uncharacterized protein n=1 Tax=Puccinia sorghi TaxID=27349 RepID=A0A0L6US19_9BASI|nr:hypothetical protein VP01_4120g2 [Puccinia sorghi]
MHSQDLKYICETINSHHFNPKKVFLSLLISQNPEIIDCLKKWPTSGINSTIELVKTIGGLLANNKSSKSFWMLIFLNVQIGNPNYNRAEATKRQLSYGILYFDYFQMLHLTTSAKYQICSISFSTSMHNSLLHKVLVFGLIFFIRFPTSSVVWSLLRFLVCGVPEKVNHLLMHHAMSCSTQTSRLHSTTGHQTRIFHGTWGYIQIPSKELLETLDPKKINLKSFQEAMQSIPNLNIQPSMFVPTLAPEES